MTVWSNNIQLCITQFSPNFTFLHTPQSHCYVLDNCPLNHGSDSFIILVLSDKPVQCQTIQNLWYCATAALAKFNSCAASKRRARVLIPLED